MKRLIGLMLALWTGAGTAWAQDAAETAAGAEASGLSVMQLMQVGGPLMWVLLLISIVAFAMIVYYAVMLRSRLIAPEAQALKLRTLLLDRRGTEARELCAQQPTALAAVVGAGLDFLKNNRDAQPELLKEIMEGEGNRQVNRMQNMIQYLVDVSAVAPMIGLLGTVMGMMKAFYAVADQLAVAKPMALAAGVGQALVTTVAGLVVAIPAMIAYAFFRGRVMKLSGQLENASTELLAILSAKR